MSKTFIDIRCCCSRPMGELVNTITNNGIQYEVYKCEESTPRFRNYHERLQAWIMFYIDAASFIDIDDDSWRMFLMFEKSGSPGSERYSIAGYITVYQVGHPHFKLTSSSAFNLYYSSIMLMDARQI